MINAHASRTPHHIGQTTKAEILVAHIIETAPADTTPERVADEDSPGRREFREARAALASRHAAPHVPH